MTDVRIDSILVTVHEKGEHALKQALRLARAMKSRLTIVDAIVDPPAYRKMAIPDYAELAGLVRSVKQERLRKLARRLKAQSLEVETKILEGEEATEIIREVVRNRHQLVVLAAEQSGNGGHVGTAGMGLLRKCPCSVWIVRPSCPGKRLRILAAVATEPTDSIYADLNVDVLNLSASLAASLRGELHILHVWRVFGERMLAHSAFCRMDNTGLEKYVNETRQHHARELHSLLKACGADLPTRCVHLLKGDVRIALPEFCRANKIDLLVLGMVGRSGISGLIIGNTAEAIADEVDCSLIAVKAVPAGVEEIGNDQKSPRDIRVTASAVDGRHC